MRIVYEPESGDRKEFSTDSKLVILGRLQSKQRDYLSLDDDKASAHHARLTCENAQYTFGSFKSQFGTSVIMEMEMMSELLNDRTRTHLLRRPTYDP